MLLRDRDQPFSGAARCLRIVSHYREKTLVAVGRALIGNIGGCFCSRNGLVDQASSPPKITANPSSVSEVSFGGDDHVGPSAEFAAVI